MKFNEIFLIVHPLFRQSQMLTQNISQEKKMVTQNEMDNYGRMILRAKENPNAIIIFVPSETKNIETRKKQARLIKFARKQARGRIVLLPTEIGFTNPREYAGLRQKGITNRPSLQKAIQKLAKFNFAKQLEMHSSGQFFGKCVQNGSKNIAKIIEQKQGTIVKIKYANWAKTITETKDVLGRKKSVKAFRKWRQQKFGKRQTTQKKYKK